MAVSSINKKIKNATKCKFKEIVFKSKLELFCYKELLKLGVPIAYEEKKFELFPKFSNQVHVFQANFKKEIVEKPVKFLPITYTPDFIFIWKYKVIIIETKGRQNDAYPLRKKMFLKLLGEYENSRNYYFFEPRNQSQVLKCIEIIKSL